MYTAKLVTIKESFSIPGKDRIIAVTLNEIEDTKVISAKIITCQISTCIFRRMYDCL